MSVGHVVHWALAVRDNDRSNALRAALARCVSPEHRPGVARMPAVKRRLEGFTDRQADGLLATVAAISLHRHTAHTSKVSLGGSLSELRSIAPLLTVASDTDAASAQRLLTSVVGRVRATNFLQLGDLLTHYDELPLNERGQLLYDFHAA